MPDRKRRLLPWLSLLVVWVVWGSTYLAIRVVVREMPPLAAASLRFAAAGLVMALVALFADRAHGWPSRRQWLDYALVGVLLLAVGNALVMWSERTIPSGIAALIVATVPLWMLLLDGLRPGGEPWTAAGVDRHARRPRGRRPRGPARGQRVRRPLAGDRGACRSRPSWTIGSLYAQSVAEARAALHGRGDRDAGRLGGALPRVAALRRGPGPHGGGVVPRLARPRLSRCLRLPGRLHRLRLLPERAARHAPWARTPTSTRWWPWPSAR